MTDVNDSESSDKSEIQMIGKRQVSIKLDTYSH